MAVVVTNIAGNASASVSGSAISASVPVGGVPAGSLIVVIAGEWLNSGSGSFTMPALTDTAGNSYTLEQVRIGNAGGTDAEFGVYFCANCLALVSGNSITYHTHQSSDTATISAFYATGLLPSPYDVAVTASVSNQSPGSGGSFASALVSGTPTASGELIVAAVGASNGGGTSGSMTYTQSSGFTAVPPPATEQATATYSLMDAGGYLINSGVGVVSYSPTLGSKANVYAAIILGFKALRQSAGQATIIF